MLLENANTSASNQKEISALS